MKNINIKKVVAGAAALAVGASFLGAAVAAQVQAEGLEPIVKNDIIGANGMPTGTIIVGSMAQPIDVMWAGNIAAAIGAKAYTTTTITTEDIIIPGTEGTTVTTVSGDGKLFDDTAISGTFNETIDEDDYSLLHDEDVSIDDDETDVVDDEINVKDSLEVTAVVDFDADEDVGALTATINKGDIAYTVEFDDGVPFGYDGSGSPKFKFHFLGKEYQVEELNAAGNTLTLVESQATVTYAEGSSFEPEEGYTIEITNILDNGNAEDPYEVEMVLKDASGTVVDTDVFQTGDQDVFEDYLTASIDVDTVYATQVKLITGSSGRIELKDGDEIEDFPTTDDELWKIELVEGETDYLTSIVMTNNDSDVEWKDEDALRVGDEIVLPTGFAKIQFVGLTEENQTEFKIEDGIISYTDDDEEDHELFIYNYDTGSDITEWNTDDEIDGHELYFEIDGTDGNITDVNHSYTASLTIQLDDDEGDYLQADGSWDSDAETWYLNANGLGTTPDANTSAIADQDQWVDLSFNSPNNEDQNFTYGLFVTESSSNITDIALGLKKDVDYPIYGGDANWTLTGVAEDVTTTFADDETYAGSKTNATTIVTDDLEAVVEFTVTDLDTTKVYVDPYTGDIVDDETDSSYVATSVAVDSENADLGNDSDDLKEAYTDFGSLYSISSTSFMMSIPEDKLYAKFFIGDGTITTSGGEEGQTIPGQEITTITPANIDVRNLVKMDNAGVGGVKIIVGGHLVNTLAQGITDDYLAEEGQYVLGKNAEGNMIVAGFTAQDTEQAAKALIDIIMG